MLSHGAVASEYFGKDPVEATFADWRTAPLGPALKATLGMLESLTLRSQSFGHEDVQRVLDAGVRPSGVEHAVLVGGFLFNIQNRLVDAFGCDIPQGKAQRAGKVLNLVGRRKVRRKKGEPEAYTGRVPGEVENLIRAIRRGAGVTTPELRTAVEAKVAALTGAARPELFVPDSLEGYLELVARRAADVTDEHVDQLKESGWTEEEIYEITVAGSVGAGLARLEIAWDALARATRT
ncbi:MAG: hypothetical protein ACFB50_14690 [Rubrobacteraceae bacterium]